MGVVAFLIAGICEPTPAPKAPAPNASRAIRAAPFSRPSSEARFPQTDKPAVARPPAAAD